MNASVSNTPLSFGSRLRSIQIDPRYLSSALITLILVLGQQYVGILHGLEQLLTSIAVCFVTELTLGRMLLGRWVNPASAYISGISQGILVRSLSVAGAGQGYAYHLGNGRQCLR